MPNYTIRVTPDLAQRLQRVDDEAIVEALDNLAPEAEHENELAKYNSVREIRNDESKSPAERKRLELKWQRRIGRRVR